MSSSGFCWSTARSHFHTNPPHFDFCLNKRASGDKDRAIKTKQQKKQPPLHLTSLPPSVPKEPNTGTNLRTEPVGINLINGPTVEEKCSVASCVLWGEQTAIFSSDGGCQPTGRSVETTSRRVFVWFGSFSFPEPRTSWMELRDAQARVWAKIISWTPTGTSLSLPPSPPITSCLCKTLLNMAFNHSVPWLCPKRSAMDLELTASSGSDKNIFKIFF